MLNLARRHVSRRGAATLCSAKRSMISPPLLPQSLFARASHRANPLPLVSRNIHGNIMSRRTLTTSEVSSPGHQLLLKMRPKQIHAFALAIGRSTSSKHGFQQNATDEGTVTLDHFLKSCDNIGYSKLGVTAQEAEVMFNEINSSGTGAVSIAEIQGWWPDHKAGSWTWREESRGGLTTEWSSVHVPLSLPSTVHLIGAGYRGGQPLPGVEGGPRAIRAQNIVGDIKDLGWRVVDSGDLDFKEIDDDLTFHLSEGRGKVRMPRNVGQANQVLYMTNRKHSKLGHLNLTMGGDHSLAMGSIAASASVWQEDLRVLWIDAHGDINTPATSPTGNLHGMPVAFLMGLDGFQPKHVPSFEWLNPCLKPHQIAFIGLRDVDEGERANLRRHNIKAYSMTDVDRRGIGAVVSEALYFLSPDSTNPIHFSFDVDGIDPLVVPSTGTRVPGGLTYREACLICEDVADTGNLVAMDLVEVNPSIGTMGDVAETASVAVGLVRSALGQTLL